MPPPDTYDKAIVEPIMAKGREVADALKQRHDAEVWQFAKEEFGGELSGSLTSSKSQRLSFKGMGGHVAARMIPDGTQALAPSGATRNW